MREIVLLKLGGSLITEKAEPDTARRKVLIRLIDEIARGAVDRPFRLVVGHGSGSYGHVAAQRFDLASGVRSADQVRGISFTQERAALLHRLVVTGLEVAGALPFSIAPSSCVAAAAGRPVIFEDVPFLLALEQGLLPVVYGDVVMDREWGASICSTEKLFDLLVRRLLDRGWTVRRVVWLGETDGLYDAAGRTVPRVTPANFAEATRFIGAPAGTDVTGGMRHRLETALELAWLGVPSVLANGLTPGVLERALRGDEVAGTEVCTEIF
jgi:isopentenyl phosphate kinase